MKIWNKFLFLSIFILALTGCSKDDDETTPVAPYHSQDMTTDDGKVTQLLKHKVGKGIPIVIMGDGFVDKDIKEGNFREATTSALEMIFSVHPMESLKDYFDVYEVTAVSYNDFDTYGVDQNSSTFKTAFSVGLAEKIPVGVGGILDGKLTQGDEKKMVEYAEKAIDKDRIDDATIIMLVNEKSNSIGITSYYNYPLYTSEKRDIPTGCSIAYVPARATNSYVVAQETLIHEFGHGFAKLADELIIEEKELDYLENDKENLMLYQGSGYSRNISLSSDVTKTPWADFAADSRYDFEKLGCYERIGFQATGYKGTGVYCATEDNVMKHSRSNPRFNVISRAMIYKRCMRIAYGDSWKFNYEDFVKFDLENAKTDYLISQGQYKTL